MKYLKILHLLFAFMWIGGAFAMISILGFVHPTTPDGLYIRSLSAQLIDDLLIIPGAVGILLSGVVYGTWSNLGFFRHRWIVAKWLITIAMVMLGTFAMGGWVNGNVYTPETLDRYITEQDLFVRNVNRTILWGGVQTACLLVVVWISVVKPWKRRSGGR